MNELQLGEMIRELLEHYRYTYPPALIYKILLNFCINQIGINEKEAREKLGELTGEEWVGFLLTHKNDLQIN